jgi:hypothetical protein
MTDLKETETASASTTVFLPMEVSGTSPMIERSACRGKAQAVVIMKRESI